MYLELIGLVQCVVSWFFVAMLGFALVLYIKNR